VAKKDKGRVRKILAILGPGLTTGAADDDPSGIATYSQTGASFGNNQLWTAIYMLPFMIAVQEACARIGMVHKKGLAAIIRDHYPKKILYPATMLVVVANTINIGADIGAMAAAAGLLVPLPLTVLTLLFTVFILILEIFSSYQLYTRVLKWLALFLLAYPATLFMIDVPWEKVIYDSVVPKIEFSQGYFFIIIGVFGTTISPYMFFWQSSQVVEEEKQRDEVKPPSGTRLKKHIRVMRLDNAIGMIFSEITTWCVLLVSASTLNAAGITHIATAADAARALEPLVNTFPDSGTLAKVIFSSGIIGLGLLAVPVLSGSAAYAVAETFTWRSGFNLKLKTAHGFYGVVTIATLLGLIINFVGINPMEALVYAAVLNGIAAIPLLFIIASVASSSRLMGSFKSGWLSRFLLWATFAAMLVSAGILTVVTFAGK